VQKTEPSGITDRQKGAPRRLSKCRVRCSRKWQIEGQVRSTWGFVVSPTAGGLGDDGVSGLLAARRCVRLWADLKGIWADQIKCGREPKREDYLGPLASFRLARSSDGPGGFSSIARKKTNSTSVDQSQLSREFFQSFMSIRTRSSVEANVAQSFEVTIRLKTVQPFSQAVEALLRDSKGWVGFCAGRLNACSCENLARF
jgi:hypothetical protein